MNITLNLPDELGREARHRAGKADQSLPTWIAGLIAREVEGNPQPAPSNLLDALGDESLGDKDFDLPSRNSGPDRPVEFP